MTEGSRGQTGKVLPLHQAPYGMELRHLRSFVAVAEELNFGRAATRLYLSQPALSRQIRALERLVGCDLLRRSTHRVALTLAGEALLDRANRLLREVDDAVAVTRSVGGEMERRLAELWAPINELATADSDLQALRNANEDLQAQFPVPEVDVRPANAGGVPSLLVRPDAASPVTLLFLHGGGYVMGSAFGYRHLAGALALAAETGVLVPEYRLAPEHQFPAALEDAMRAYLWLIDSGVSPDDVILAGDSAGAGLAMSLLLTLKERAVALPAGAMLLCPGIDLTFTSLVEVEELPQDIRLDQLQSFAAAYLAGHPADEGVVYPLGADLGGLPPLLIQGGASDVFVGDARRLHERARQHGVDAELELYAVPTHDFHIFWSFLPEAADALHQAGRFARGLRATDHATGRASGGAAPGG
jgi:monoterpene epsilon-lactone hydrolase